MRTDRKAPRPTRRAKDGGGLVMDGRATEWNTVRSAVLADGDGPAREQAGPYKGIVMARAGGGSAGTRRLSRM